MARPKKANALSAKVDLRLTTQQLADWRVEAEGLGVSLGEWIRARVENGTVANPVARIEVKADPEARRQLAAIGNNLNQMARAVNQCGFEPSDAARLLSYLSAMNDELAGIRELLHQVANAEGVGVAS